MFVDLREHGSNRAAKRVATPVIPTLLNAGWIPVWPHKIDIRSVRQLHGEKRDIFSESLHFNKWVPQPSFQIAAGQLRVGGQAEGFRRIEEAAPPEGFVR